MKLESLKMNHKLLKTRVNNQKGQSIKGKRTKIAAAFMQNKPNSKNIKIVVSSFGAIKYEILPARRSKKQTQFKANSNPIAERPKINVRKAITMNYKDFIPLAETKTNPNKANSNPISNYPCLFIFTLYNLPEKNKSRFNLNGDFTKWQMHPKQMQ